MKLTGPELYVALPRLLGHIITCDVHRKSVYYCTEIQERKQRKLGKLRRNEFLE